MDSLLQAFSGKILTITHATEDLEKVTQAVRNLILAETRMGSTINRARGHHGNEIVTLVFTTRNVKSAETLLQNIWNGLSELDKAEVYSSLASRIDSSGTLFLRLDKQDALKRRIRLENSDPIKIEISFRTKSHKDDDLMDGIRRTLEEIQRPTQ